MVKGCRTECVPVVQAACLYNVSHLDPFLVGLSCSLIDVIKGSIH